MKAKEIVEGIICGDITVTSEGLENLAKALLVAINKLESMQNDVEDTESYWLLQEIEKIMGGE